MDLRLLASAVVAPDLAIRQAILDPILTRIDLLAGNQVRDVEMLGTALALLCV
jgi:hypothetical protein